MIQAQPGPGIRHPPSRSGSVRSAQRIDKPRAPGGGAAAAALLAAILCVGVAGVLEAQRPPGFDKLRVASVRPDTVAAGGLLVVELDAATLDSVFDPTGLVLYLDHFPLPGIVPVAGGIRRSRLEYRLDRTEQNAEAWVRLLRRHGIDLDTVTVSVGMVPFGEVPTSSGKPERIQLAVLRRWPLWAGGTVAIAMALAMIFLGNKLLRERPRPLESVSDPDPPARIGRATPDPVPPEYPFSLGRVIVAFWLTVVTACYAFITLATDRHNQILNQTAITLLAIGAITAFGSRAIQQQKQASALRKVSRLRPELARANEEERAAAPEEAVEARARTLAIRAEITDLEGRLGKSAHRGFWEDLLEDETGPSIHRFQIVAWTLLLGIIYVRYVIWYVSMPTFDPSLLTLLGISSGTFLGLKIPERQP